MSPFPSDSKTPLQPPPSYTNNKSNPNAQSELPSSSSSSSTPRPQFATLHLAQTDRVRLIGFPPDVIPAVNGAIVRVWITGIQRQGQFDTVSWEWKLSGRPCKWWVLYEYHWRGLLRLFCRPVNPRKLACNIVPHSSVTSYLWLHQSPTVPRPFIYKSCRPKCSSRPGTCLLPSLLLLHPTLSARKLTTPRVRPRPRSHPLPPTHNPHPPRPRPLRLASLHVCRPFQEGMG